MHANTYTALLRPDGEWWVGWVEEVPGVNCQERTREQLLASLQEALREMLDLNREAARAAAEAGWEEAAINA